MKNVSRKLSFALAIAIAASFLNPITTVQASESVSKNGNVAIVDIQGEQLSLETNIIHEDLILLKTKFKNEYNEVYVDLKNERVLLNGQQFNLTKKIVIEDDLMRESLINSVKSPWNPVYQYTTKYYFADMVATVGAIASIVGGAILLAGSVAVGVSTSLLAKQISNWATAVGLGSTFTGAYFDGYLSCPTYRTQGLVPTGYGGNQYAYRYQNVRSIFKLGKKSGNVLHKSTGSWWFGTKPMQYLSE